MGHPPAYERADTARQLVLGHHHKSRRAKQAPLPGDPFRPTHDERARRCHRGRVRSRPSASLRDPFQGNPLQDRSETLNGSAQALADARRSGTLALQARLKDIRTQEEADTVAALAAAAYGGTQRGHAMAATSALTARLLRCEDPVWGPLFEDDMLPSGASFRLPRGALGVGAGFSFVMGLSFAIGADRGSARRLADAVVSCTPTLQLLGRRVPNDEPLNSWTATADFGLDLLHVRGPAIEGWRDLDLSAGPVVLRLDGHAIGSGLGRDSLGGPLAALEWLARQLAARGSHLGAGDVVATGSCTGLAQIIPGQTVTGDFGPLGSVSLRLT